MTEAPRRYWCGPTESRLIPALFTWGVPLGVLVSIGGGLASEGLSASSEVRDVQLGVALCGLVFAALYALVMQRAFRTRLEQRGDEPRLRYVGFWSSNEFAFHDVVEVEEERRSPTAPRLLMSEASAEEVEASFEASPRSYRLLDADGAVLGRLSGRYPELLRRFVERVRSS